VQVGETVDVADIVAALELGDPRALVIIIGGAGRMAEVQIQRVRPLFVEGLALLAAQERIAILDGGANTGVMALTGEGAATHGLTAPLIGVCPKARVSWPGRWNPWTKAELEPNHSHFVLTSGMRFGDESAIFYALARTLGKRMPSLALMVNRKSTRNFVSHA